jgi:hypothetical protein
MSNGRWVQEFEKGKQVVVLIKITHYVTYVILCVNTYISETRFQHVVKQNIWVSKKCIWAQIKLLYAILTWFLQSICIYHSDLIFVWTPEDVDGTI